jgi:hypothetical protein
MVAPQSAIVAGLRNKNARRWKRRAHVDVTSIIAITPVDAVAQVEK